MRSPGFKVMLRGSDLMLRMCKEGREKWNQKQKYKTENERHKAS